MRTRYWLILLIASFALGAGADYKINALQKRKLALIEEKTRQEAAKQEAIKQETAKQERFAAIETPFIPRGFGDMATCRHGRRMSCCHWRQPTNRLFNAYSK